MALPALTPRGTSVGTGVPKRLRVRPVEQFHGLVVHLAAAHGLAQPVVQITDVESGEVGQCFHVVGVDGLIGVAEHVSVVSVRGDPFESVEDGMLEGPDVLVGGCLGVDAVRAPSLSDLRGGVPRRERRRSFREGDLWLLGGEGRLDSLASLDGGVYPSGQRVGIEIDVGEGREETLLDERISVVRYHTGVGTFLSHKREPFERVDKGVLDGRDLGGLAADASPGTGYRLRGLLALITEHSRPPCWFWNARPPLWRQASSPLREEEANIIPCAFH